jgi:hypothetical protein
VAATAALSRRGVPASGVSARRSAQDVDDLPHRPRRRLDRDEHIFGSSLGGARQLVLDVQPIPEPSTGLLVIADLLGLAGWREVSACALRRDSLAGQEFPVPQFREMLQQSGDSNRDFDADTISRSPEFEGIPCTFPVEQGIRGPETRPAPARVVPPAKLRRRSLVPSLT